MSKTVKATFRDYFGSKEPRWFLHFAEPWKGGETREVTPAEAKQLKAEHGEHFEFPKDEPDKPAKEQ